MASFSAIDFTPEDNETSVEDTEIPHYRIEEWFLQRCNESKKNLVSSFRFPISSYRGCIM